METTQRAVLFVDVTDSTKIYESLGDTVALALINGVFARLDKIVAKYAGSVVKSLGDGIICVFEDPDNAFRAALESLEGDEGAKSLLAGHAGELVKIPVGDPGVIRDIDTPGDLAPPIVV